MSCYKDFNDLYNRSQKLKLSGWELKKKDRLLCISKHDEIHLIPSHEIIIKDDLEFSVSVFNWRVPNDHQLYVETSKTLREITLSRLISLVSRYDMCNGVHSLCNRKDKVTQHSVPKIFNSFLSKSPLQETVYYRSEECRALVSDTGTTECKSCKKISKEIEKAEKRKILNAISIPAKTKAPVSKTDPAKIKLTLQNIRAENKTLKTQVDKLQAEIQKSAVEIKPELEDDLKTVMSAAPQSQISPFMKLF